MQILWTVERVQPTMIEIWLCPICGLSMSVNESSKEKSNGNVMLSGSHARFDNHEVIEPNHHMVLFAKVVL